MSSGSVSRNTRATQTILGYVGAGQFMVLLERGDYWQCGYVIRKGEFDERRQRGLKSYMQTFRDRPVPG